LTHKARKRFGQHFLRDVGTINRIVMSIAPRAGETMVEIGPGQGAITKSLLRALGRLVVVELDRDLIPQLYAACNDLGHLEVHNSDALKFDFGQLAPSDAELRVVGNLPYNISTPLIFHLLRYSGIIKDMHFLLQKEVVDRITAKPRCGEYARLSVMVQYRCQTTRLFTVAAECFSPPPQVQSAMLRLIPYKVPPFQAHNERRFANLVTTAFSHRRKTLKNALKNLLSSDQIAAAGIDSGCRAEELTVEQFVGLANSSRY